MADLLPKTRALGLQLSDPKLGLGEFPSGALHAALQLFLGLARRGKLRPKRVTLKGKPSEIKTSEVEHMPRKRGQGRSLHIAHLHPPQTHMRRDSVSLFLFSHETNERAKTIAKAYLHSHTNEIVNLKVPRSGAMFFC